MTRPDTTNPQHPGGAPPVSPPLRIWQTKWRPFAKGKGQFLAPHARLGAYAKRLGAAAGRARSFEPKRLHQAGTLPLRFMKRLLGQWRLFASALIAAAIIHILATLSAAHISEASSYRILTKGLVPNRVSFVAPITPAEQPLPFLSPDTLYALCPYDASTAKIRVSAKLPDTGWSLSLHTTRGENFYYVPGTARQETNIELVLEPPGNVFAHDAIEVTTANAAIPTVKLPEVRGLIIVRAPIKGRAYLEQTDRLRTLFSCRAQDGK